MSKELINDCYKNYTARMAGVYLYQYETRSKSQRELVEINKHIEEIKTNSQFEEYFRSIYNMHFQSALNGGIKQFDHRIHSVEDWIQAVHIRKNKQYQWLLAEAYEYFEDAVEDAYAFLGFKDNDAWPLKDFGEITISELKIKSFSWFQEKARSKRIEELLNYFRKKFIEIEDKEINNELSIDLRFCLIIAMMLRHIIVHKGGRTDDKEELVKSIFKKAGIYNNGRLDKDKKQLIESFFGVGKTTNMVYLVESSVRMGIPDNSQIDRLKNILLNSMMAYIEILYEVLMQKLGLSAGE